VECEGVQECECPFDRQLALRSIMAPLHSITPLRLPAGQEVLWLELTDHCAKSEWLLSKDSMQNHVEP
jgi:hypothetical protein